MLFTVRLIHPGLGNLMWGPTIPISKRDHFTGFGLVSISKFQTADGALFPVRQPEPNPSKMICDSGVMVVAVLGTDKYAGLYLGIQSQTGVCF